MLMIHSKARATHYEVYDDDEPPQSQSPEEDTLDENTVSSLLSNDIGNDEYDGEAGTLCNIHIGLFSI